MKLSQLVIKDFKNVLYDTKSLAILVIMPIVVMSILGFSLKGMFGDEITDGFEPMSIVVVKEYDLALDQEQFKNVFENNPMVDLTTIDFNNLNLETIMFNDFLEDSDLKELLSYKIVSSEEVNHLMEADEIVAAVILPKEFVYNGYVNFFTSNRNVIDIKVISNPSFSFSAQIVTSIFDSFTNNINLQKARSSALIGDLLSKSKIDAIEEVMKQTSSNTSNQNNLTIRQLSANQQESITSFQYYAAAIMSMFLLYSATFGGRAILSEKKEFTMARLSVTGISLTKIIFSNFIRISLLSMFQSLVMIVYSTFVLQVSWGNILHVFVGVFFTSLTVGGFGMLLSVLTLTSNSYSIANIFEFVVIQVMALVGGSFIPIEVLPKAIGNLSFLSISGLGIKIYTDAMYNQSIASSQVPLLLLILYTVILISLSLILVKIKRKKVKAC